MIVNCIDNSTCTACFALDSPRDYSRREVLIERIEGATGVCADWSAFSVSDLCAIAVSVSQ
jgi:hypothetical protein